MPIKVSVCYYLIENVIEYIALSWILFKKNKL